MTKEEKIKEAYESYGFDWNECEIYVCDNGILTLPTPDLKYSLKGYENLIKDEERFSSFGKDGLKLQPSLLKGLFNNNGWIKIESEADLPKEDCKLHVYPNYLEMDIFFFYNDELSIDELITNHTHYQQIEKPKPPIY